MKLAKSLNDIDLSTTPRLIPSAPPVSDDELIFHCQKPTHPRSKLALSSPPIDRSVASRVLHTTNISNLSNTTQLMSDSIHIPLDMSEISKYFYFDFA
jgi:hypothetical protein